MLEQQLLVGRTYRFTFKPEFEEHGVCSTPGKKCLHRGGGVFTVKQITTYADMIRAEDGNLYDSFFRPLGISETVYKSYFSGGPVAEYEPETTKIQVVTSGIKTGIVDGTLTTLKTKSVHEKIVETGNSIVKKSHVEALNFANAPIYKVEDVVSGVEDVLWIPELALACIPEVSIEEFRNVSLAVDIGYWDKPEEMDNIVTRIRQDLMMYGIPPLKVNLISVDSKWMNREEYESLTTIRVPGRSATITRDNKQEFLRDGKMIIVGGQLKKLVETVAEGRESLDVAIDNFVTKKKTISLADFITELYESHPSRKIELDGKTYYLDVMFEENVKYLTKVNDYGVYEVCSENVDPTSEDGNVVGNIIGNFVEDENGTFIDEGPYYVKVEEDEVREGTKYYRQMEYTQYTGSYNSSIQYYKEVDGAIVPYSFHDESEFNVYITENSVYVSGGTSYIAMTEEQIASKEFEMFALISLHRFRELGDNESYSGTKYTKKDMYRLDYAKKAAADIVGKTFKYSPSEGGVDATSVVLKPSDVVVFAHTKSKVAKMTEVVANLYEGMWFEYFDVSHPGEDNESIVQRIFVIRSANLGSSGVANKLGTIYGVSGEISEEVFVSDESVTRERNYYRMYMEKLHEYDLKCAEANALREKLTAVLRPNT